MMSKNSKIEWTDHTFNPWIGCAKVSAGCANCYAEKVNHRYGWVKWGVDGTRRRTSEANWRKLLGWNKSDWVACERCGWRGLAKKAHWAKGKASCPQCDGRCEFSKQRVFVASLADVFEDRSELVEWRKDLFDLILATPNLDWLILTKRPENVNRMISETTYGYLDAKIALHYYPNVWIGTSVENQETADERIPALLKIPSRVRFLSMEPLLDAVDLARILAVDGELAEWVADNVSDLLFPADLLDWVIVGGESGPKARPMHPNWVRSIREQCKEAGIPFFFKQWGAYRLLDNAIDMGLTNTYDGKFKPYTYIGSLPFARVGKKRAGRVLDGRTWDEFPREE